MRLYNMPRIMIIVFYVVVINYLVIISTDVGEGVCSMSESQVYFFEWAEIEKIASRVGHPDFVDHVMSRNGTFDTISRNAEGTSINVINRTNKRALVLNCDGSIKYIELPTRFSWLDKNNNVLVWPENNFDDSKNFLKGHPPVSFEAIDPSGQYFISYFDNKYFAISSVAKPDIPLAKVNVIGSQFLYIFSKKSKLYVFGFDERGLNIPLKCFIYEVNGEKIKLVEEFQIPREGKYHSPYIVEDMSPWSDEILLLDVRFFPSFSKWYIYNIKTKKLKYYGRAVKNRGLFMQCNVLERVKEKQKK